MNLKDKHTFWNWYHHNYYTSILCQIMGDNETKKRSLESTTLRKSPKLLLHCVDGCVPYLNPNQLEEHFPPFENTDLWLGLAVRDACVAPIFQSTNDNAKKKKTKQTTNSNKNNNDTTAAAASSSSSSSSSSSINKVRGYTFCSTPPDPWLLPYTRFTVPAFDLESDTNASTSKNTNNAVYVWTPHGRQKLTADLYAKAALEGLQSQHTVSLFDEVEEYSVRRKQKAESRNSEWYKHLQESSAATSSTTSNDEKQTSSLLWKPILLTPDDIEESKSEPRTTSTPKSKEGTLPKEVPAPVPVPSGLAFVGRWRSDLQLNTVVENTLLEKVPFKAMLTTRSLSEILDIATKGIVNVIGTNLPEKWAKDKLALGLDLSIVTSGEEKDAKRQKIDSSTESDGVDVVVLNEDGCMDLSDKKYARDPRPLVPGCDSFACLDNRFSRAYIHHLVVAKEMVAEILLFGHNLHCLLQLVRCFNGDESQREIVKESILRQIANGKK